MTRYNPRRRIGGSSAAGGAADDDDDPLLRCAPSSSTLLAVHLRIISQVFRLVPLSPLVYENNRPFHWTIFCSASLVPAPLLPWHAI